MPKASAKDKIIATARQLFAEHGFAGTSTQSIADAAEVSHSLIFHHFTNKEALWQAVKQNIAQDETQQSKILPDTALPFADFLKELIVRNIYFYQEHTDIVRMINWQRLEKMATHPKKLSAESQSWLEAIKYYQQNGELNLHLEPRFIMGLILSVTSAAALDSHIWIQSKEEYDRYIQFCIDSLQIVFAKLK